MSNVSFKGGSSLEDIIGETLEGAEATVILASKDAAKNAADFTARELKSTSPKGATGKYAKGWSVKAQDGGYVVYNKKRYMLTHLLENGHDVIVNGKKVGRAKAHPHIKPAEQDGIKQFELWVKTEIERRLANG